MLLCERPQRRQPTTFVALLPESAAHRRLQICGTPSISVTRVLSIYVITLRERLDTVQGFVAEECALAPEAWTRRSELYRAYRAWIQEGGRLPVSVVTFNDHLRRGFSEQVIERTRNGIRGWLGIGLLEGRGS